MTVLPGKPFDDLEQRRLKDSVDAGILGAHALSVAEVQHADKRF
jgi:hypothetical protein